MKAILISRLVNGEPCPTVVFEMHQCWPKAKRLCCSYLSCFTCGLSPALYKNGHKALVESKCESVRLIYRSAQSKGTKALKEGKVEDDQNICELSQMLKKVCQKIKIAFIVIFTYSFYL